MPSLDKPPVVPTTVKWRFPAIHRESYKFIAIVAVVGAIALFFTPLYIWPLIVWPFLLLALAIASFFRDPIRMTPQGEGLVVAPADGLITMIERVPLPPQLRGPDALGEGALVRISIFMSVFDVHINRAAVGGTVRHISYVPGKFLNADLDKASEENERNYIVFEQPDGLRVGITQIAGLVARRIVPFVKVGDRVEAGERVGLIRFGSRVDVFVPESHAPRVALGQRTIAGETVLATPGSGGVTGLAQ